MEEKRNYNRNSYFMNSDTVKKIKEADTLDLEIEPLTKEELEAVKDSLKAKIEDIKNRQFHNQIMEFDLKSDDDLAHAIDQVINAVKNNGFMSSTEICRQLLEDELCSKEPEEGLKCTNNSIGRIEMCDEILEIINTDPYILNWNTLIFKYEIPEYIVRSYYHIISRSLKVLMGDKKDLLARELIRMGYSINILRGNLQYVSREEFINLIDECPKEFTDDFIIDILEELLDTDIIPPVKRFGVIELLEKGLELEDVLNSLGDMIEY